MPIPYVIARPDISILSARAVPLRPAMSNKGILDLTDVPSLPLEDDTEARQFVLRLNGERARMEYDRSSDRIFLTGINVPRSLADHGVSDVLTERVLLWVEAEGLRLVPTCPAVKDYLRRNTAWQRLLLKGVQLR